MQEQTKESSLFATIDGAGNDFDIDFSKELKDRIKENPSFKPKIRYNKKPFSTLIFPNFTPLDFNLFMCFCFVANEKGSLKIKLNFKDLEFLMGRVEKNPKRLFERLDEFIKKAMKTIIKQTEFSDKFRTNTYAGFFESIKIYEKEKIIIIQFNELMVSALNNFKFTRFYTQFELKQYCELKSKYSKQLCILLMDNLYTGEPLKKSREELIEYLGLNEKRAYKDENNFKKYILDIVCKELGGLFTNFKIERICGNGKSNRKVIAYNFIYKK